MFRIRLLIAGLMVAVGISAPPASAQSVGEKRPAVEVLAGGSCIIVGSVRSPAIIIVYEETNQSENGQVLLKEQWIQKEEKKSSITSATGRIRYVYRFSSSDPWSQPVGASCINNSEVRVP